MLKHVDVNIELIQSMGKPTPWSSHIDHQKGTSIQHIAVGRGDIPRDEWLRIGSCSITASLRTSADCIRRRTNW